MAVIQISRIQHRSGTTENLPQLARGEIGLAVDSRRIFIGNGGDGAPKTENLEFLTTRSDILGLADTYTYKDSQIGFSATTGPSAGSPITRTLQDKLDDVASVRDFGAVGDGTTDDTAAINRALYELFAREQITRVRRSLFFPAGTYLVTDTIKVPSYAKIYGEGPDSTTITSTDITGPVMQTADSLQQVEAEVGANGAINPTHIIVEDMTVTATTDIDILLLDQAVGCHFRNVNLIGFASTVPTNVGNQKSVLRIKSTTTYKTSQCSFTNCILKCQSFICVADNDMESITWDRCKFDIAYKGFKIGEDVTAIAPSLVGPGSLRVQNSIFDNIYNNGIHVYDGFGFVSAYNYFKDVANNNLGNNNATTHVVNYAISNCHSIGDYFDRPDADVSTSTQRVNGKQGINSDNTEGVKFGNYRQGYGTSATLTDNSTATLLTFPDNQLKGGIEITYVLNRNSQLRQGKITLLHDATGQVIDDDFQENDADVGVTWAVNNAANNTSLRYTTSSTGQAVSMYYTVRTILQV